MARPGLLSGREKTFRLETERRNMSLVTQAEAELRSIALGDELRTVARRDAGPVLDRWL